MSWRFYMASIRLPEELEQRLEAFASAHNQHSKSYYVKEAIEAYLNDMEDIEEAQSRLCDPESVYLNTKDFL